MEGLLLTGQPRLFFLKTQPMFEEKLIYLIRIRKLSNIRSTNTLFFLSAPEMQCFLETDLKKAQSCDNAQFLRKFCNIFNVLYPSNQNFTQPLVLRFYLLATLLHPSQITVEAHYQRPDVTHWRMV